MAPPERSVERDTDLIITYLLEDEDFVDCRSVEPDGSLECDSSGWLFVLTQRNDKC